MDQKPKILFAIPTLYAGGAERIVSFLAQNVNQEKFESHLLIAGKKSDAAYEFDPERTTFLSKSRVRKAIPSVIRFLLNYKPDIVFATLDFNTLFGLLAPLFPRIKFIVRIPNVLSVVGKYSKATKMHGILARLAYKNVDLIVCQSQGMAKDFLSIYPINPEIVVVVNNPITNLFPLKKMNPSTSTRRFITVGRLSAQKGHLRIIKLLSQLDYPFHYTIIGSGDQKDILFEEIRKRNLSDRITYIPFTKEVSKHLANHDLFLQGSYVEGFPNAVLESMVIGTPVLAFFEPGGTTEIIENGLNGFVVKNENEYLEKLQNIDGISFEPKKIRETVLNKFGTKIILEKYENLYHRILNEK